MKKIALVFLVLLLGGCSRIDEPEGFVKQILFTSDIIDVEKMQINSKDELIESVDTTALYYGIMDSLAFGFMPRYHSYRLVVNMTVDYYFSRENIIYIEPLSNGKPILDKSIYSLGMPIIFKANNNGRGKPSKQPVVLIKGKSEWADSSYRGFTILPVADSGNDNGNLDFNWTIRKM